MVAVAGVTVDFEARLVKWEENLTKAQRNVDGLASTVSKATGAIESQFRRIERAAGSLGIALGVGGLVAFGKQVFESIGTLDRQAEALGVSAKMLQVYQFAAGQTSVSTDTLETGLRRLTKSIGEAHDQNDAAVKKFEDLGIKLIDVSGNAKTTEQVLDELALAYANSGNKAQFAAQLVGVMGREGQKLLPLLAAMAAGTSAWSQKAEEAGVIVRDKIIKQFDEANNLFAKWGKQITVLAAEMIEGQLLPVFRQTQKEIEGIINITDRVIQSFVNWGKAAISLGNLLAAPFRLLAEKSGLISPGAGFIPFAGPPRAPGSMGEEKGMGFAAPFRSLGGVNPQGLEALKKQQADLLAFENFLAETDQKTATSLAKLRDELDPLEKITRESQEAQLLLTRANLDSALSADKLAEFTRILTQDTEQQINKAKEAAAFRDDPLLIVKREVAAVDQLLAARRRGAAEFEKTKFALDTENNLRALGITLTDDQREALERLAAQLGVTAAAMKELDADERELQSAIKEAGRQILTEFEDAILEGKKFSDVIRAIERDLIHLGNRILLQQPLERALTGGTAASGGGGGGLFGAFINWLSGAGGGATGSIASGTASSTAVDFLATGFHEGGVVGRGGTPRLASNSVFVGAPRMHSGGLMGLRPFEVPAILEQGERVIPRGASSRGGDINVHVYGVTDAPSFMPAIPQIMSRIEQQRRAMDHRGI